jgi:hypothetical protein
LETKVFEAAKDLRYLLERGYRRESALRLIVDKYQLSAKQKLLLYRAIYDSSTAAKHKEKIVTADMIKDSNLAVDGYNVMITVESGLRGRLLVLCDDSFIRDISAVHGKYRMTNMTEKALSMIVNALQELKPAKTNFFFDAQVSKSGELASQVRRTLKSSGLNGNAYAVERADVSTLNFGDIVATSDSVLISKARAVFDLAAEILKKNYSAAILVLHDSR